jgi:hypothetical protein
MAVPSPRPTWASSSRDRSARSSHAIHRSANLHQSLKVVAARVRDRLAGSGQSPQRPPQQRVAQGAGCSRPQARAELQAKQELTRLSREVRIRLGRLNLQRWETEQTELDDVELLLR